MYHWKKYCGSQTHHFVDAAHSSDLITFVFRSHIKPIFQSIAAKVGSEPCCDWVRIAQKTPSWFFLQLLKLSC